MRDRREIRENGLRRLLRAKRWILATSIALTGALGALAASAFPGKTIKPAGAGAQNTPSSAESSSEAGAASESPSGSLSPPEQAPQSPEQGLSPPSAEAPVVSGGS